MVIFIFRNPQVSGFGSDRSGFENYGNRVGGTRIKGSWIGRTIGQNELVAVDAFEYKPVDYKISDALVLYREYFGK